jgi:S1-C subfamily serine protease
VTLANGQSYPAALKGQAPDDDLALLKIDAKSLTPIAFAESKNVQVGQFAIAIGSPLGLEQSATFGIVSAVNRTATEGSDGPARYPLTGLIQTSAPINPGNSGGALVDLQGRLIGVPTLAAANPNSGAAADGIGFAIPSDRVKFVADQLISTGKLTNTGRGFLGVQVQDVTPELAAAYNLPAKSGVLVVAFGQDANGKSPAQDAGVKTGDIITAVNGQEVASSSNLSTVLSGQAPGAQVTLKIVRGSQTLNIKVTLGERPAQ